METAITKGKGIDTLVRGYSPNKVEEEKEMQCKGDPALQEVIEKYEASVFDKPKPDLHDYSEVLTPEQIKHFAIWILQYDQVGNYSILRSSVLKKLIANSYQAGHNNFFIPKENSTWGYVGSNLDASGRKCKIDVSGRVHGCGVESVNVDITVHGGVALFAYRTKDSVFTFNGEIVTDVRKEHRKYLARGARHCIFRTPHEENIEKLQHFVPWGNRIILIKGEEEEVVRIGY